MERNVRFRIVCLFIWTSGIPSFGQTQNFKSGGTGLLPYTFYFNSKEGYFYIIPPKPLADWGCIDLLHEPLQIIGSRNFNSWNGEQCAILYNQKGCRGGSLKETLTNEYIRSFQLCQGKAQSHPRGLYMSLYDKPNYEAILVHFNYNDLEDCKNLPDYADKKVSSIDKYGNCVNLFDSKDCRGTSVKMRMSSGHNLNLNDVEWDNRISSVKACRVTLHAVISGFKVVPVHDADDDLQKARISTDLPFINNATVPIWKSFNATKTFNQTFIYGRIDSLEQMESVEVSRHLKMEGLPFPQLCFWDDINSNLDCVSVEGMENDLKNTYQFRQNNRWSRVKEFSISKPVKVPPCSEVKVTSALLVKENINLNFELLVRISGEYDGVRMTPHELLNHLPEGMTYLWELGSFEILAQTSGRIAASVGVRSVMETEILPGTISNCGGKMEPSREPVHPSPSPPTIPTSVPSPTSFRTRQPKTTRPKWDISNDSRSKSLVNPNSDPDQGQLGYLLMLLVGIVTLTSVITVLLLSMWARRSQSSIRNPSEIDILTVGDQVLTIQFLCCPPR